MDKRVSGGASQAIIKINNRKRNQGSTKQQKIFHKLICLDLLVSHKNEVPRNSGFFLPGKPHTILEENENNRQLQTVRKPHTQAGFERFQRPYLRGGEIGDAQTWQI